MKKLIYAVTGATGHLGNNIIEQLVNAKQTVRALVLNGENTDMLDNSVQIFYGDVCDKQSLMPFLEHNDNEKLIVIHTAGIVCITEKYDQRVYDVNVKGTQNVVECAIEQKVHKLVYTSSVHAIATKPNEVVTDCQYFNPDLVKGNYAKTKAIATQYVLDMARSGKINASVIFPSGIIGIRDYQHNHLVKLIENYISGKLPIAVKGEYDFVDVEDVAQATIRATTLATSGDCYLITNQKCTIKRVLDMVADALGLKKVKNYISIRFAKLFAPLCERYYRKKKVTPLFTKYSLEVLESGDTFSHQKATQVLDYHPKDIHATLRNTAMWLVNNKGITIPKRMLLKTPTKYPKRKRLTTAGSFIV